jgi:MFS family permease
MDQQLFNLARAPAIAELRATPPDEDLAVSKAKVTEYGGYATMIFMMGWAAGGIFFGILGDRIGRVRTMILTILAYSVFTGLSALSVGIWDFSLYRFLTGLGVGGEFAVGVALVAEVMPDRARPHALGLLQASSAVGNMVAACISLVLGHLERAGTIASAWRLMFVLGVLPAILVLFIMRRLKEPERWQATATGAGQKLGSLRELFGEALWRRRAIIGMLLAFSGVVGLWGIGFFSFDLTRSVFVQPLVEKARLQGAEQQDELLISALMDHPEHFAEAARRIRPNDLINPDATALFKGALALWREGKTLAAEPVLQAAHASKRFSAEDEAKLLAWLAGPRPAKVELLPAIDTIERRVKDIDGQLTVWAAITSLLFNLGAFFGVYAFSWSTQYIGRKPAFAIGFVLALLSTAFTFWSLKSYGDVFWMIPLMGFCQLSVFGGYAIYFPELFPTRLRSTGTSFCYNVGRFVAAIGPMFLGLLTSQVFIGFPREPMRYAGVTMCAFFLIGIMVLPFAPETRGRPLPE